MYNNSCVYPHVIYGIEISCADKIHVVGIFDKKNKNAGTGSTIRNGGNESL